MNAAEAVVAQGREIYGATADAFTEYSNRVAAYARDAGVISRDGYTEMVQKHLFYIPMQRVMEADPAAARSGSGGTLQAQNPLRRIEGSTRQIVDPIESVIRNTFLMTQMAERNNVGRALIALLGGTERAVPTTSDQPTKAKLAALLREHGVDLPESMASLADGLQPVRDGEIRIMTDGKPETYLVDPELARSFKNLDQETANLLVQLLGAPARTLRAGATLTPDFVARNLIRDLSGAALYTGKGIFSPIDTMKGLIGAIRKDADYQRWISEGGASASMVSLDRNYLQTSIEKLTQETGLATRAWNVIRHPIDTLRAVSELAEEATRLGEFKGVYKRMVEEGASPQEAGKEAAYSSREVTLDFARMGAKIKAMNMITAFFNAQVQGVDRFVRAARDNPGPLAIKTLAGITMPSMLLWWANHEDPRYNEIPNWQKDLFWIVMTKDTIYRIPKPFEVGIIFGSGVERALDAFVANKPDAFKGYGGSLMGGLLPSFVPTAALPLVEQFANRSTFSDRTLVPDQAEKLLPEYQYTPYTTETAKALGKLMGAFPGMRDQSLEHGTGGAVARALTSPILLENYLRAWTGNMGVYALALVDKGLRTAGVVPSPVKPDDTLADVPFVKAFVVRYPSASAQSLQDFRDSYDKNKVYFDTWMAMARSGDLAAAQHVQEIGGPGMMLQLSAIKETISEHSNLVRGIYTNPDISSGEKRQLIDTMYWRMIELAQIGNKANREISAQMEGKTK